MIKKLLPPPRRRERQLADARMVLNGMVWVMRTGAPWRSLPERYRPWRTVYDRFSLWSRDATLERIVSRLQALLDEQRRIDWELFLIDGSVVRTSRAAAGARKKSGAANR